MSVRVFPIWLFFVIKVLPQLHFVLIYYKTTTMQYAFFPIMTRCVDATISKLYLVPTGKQQTRIEL